MTPSAYGTVTAEPPSKKPVKIKAFGAVTPEAPPAEEGEISAYGTVTEQRPEPAPRAHVYATKIIYPESYTTIGEDEPVEDSDTTAPAKPKRR